MRALQPFQIDNHATPPSILRAAIRAVPAVKYALGIAGIISVIALVPLLNLNLRAASWGIVVMLILMTMLVLFARLAATAPSHFLIPCLVFTWFSLLLTMSAAILMFTSVFFQKPLDLRDWIAPPKDRTDRYGTQPSVTQQSDNSSNVAKESAKPQVQHSISNPPTTHAVTSKSATPKSPSAPRVAYPKWAVGYWPSSKNEATDSSLGPGHRIFSTLITIDDTDGKVPLIGRIILDRKDSYIWNYNDKEIVSTECRFVYSALYTPQDETTIAIRATLTSGPATCKGMGGEAYLELKGNLRRIADKIAEENLPIAGVHQLTYGN